MSVAVPGWRAHPLSKALLANEAGHAQLLLASGSLISSAADRGPAERQALLRRVMPFISFALLDPSASGAAAAAAPPASSSHCTVLAPHLDTHADSTLQKSLRAGGRATFGALLHLQLVRLACGHSTLTLPLLKLLCAHLPCYSLQSHAQRSWVTARAADIVDLVECAGKDGKQTTSVLLRASLRSSVFGLPHICGLDDASAAALLSDVPRTGEPQRSAVV